MRRGIYVLEGTDLAGKTTLAEFIKGEVKDQDSDALVMTHHFSAPKDKTRAELFAEYSTAILAAYEAVKEDNATVIFDRLHVGEYVYGSLFRKPLFAFDHIKAIDVMLDTLFATKIFVDASSDVLRQRFDKRGDASHSLQDILRASTAYRDILLPLEFDGPSALDGWIHFLPGTERML